MEYGLIVTGGRLRTWQLNCIERLHQSKLARLRCIVNDTARGGSESASLAGIRALETDLRQFDLASSDAQSVEHVTRAAPVDFYLLLGDEASGAPFIGAAPYGVWYFAHGDVRNFSTSEPGFWELYFDHDVTAAFLLQLRGDGTAGVPLKFGYMPTKHESFELNAATACDALARWPLHVCWDIAHGAAHYFDSAPIPKPAMHYGRPSRLQIAKVRLRERRKRAAAYIRGHCYKVEWTVGCVRESPADFIGADRAADVSYLLPRSKNRYFADPCLLTRDSRAYLFCEEYRCDTGSGSVAFTELGGGTAAVPRTAIREPHHLSYPHVFEHRGETFCIPESGKIKKVCLYRCVEFPGTWEFVHILIDGFEAADSTILQHEGRWWLFCTSSEAMEKGYYSHLYIWHAEDLFGTWVPHLGNPVKIDARCARPAGPFFTHEGRLYRPSQDCARSYGGALRINCVDVLTQEAFEEHVVGTIRPPKSGYTRGLHTISAAGQWCVVDVERYTFDPAGAAYAFKLAAKNVLLRLGMPERSIDRLRRKPKDSERTEIAAAQPFKSE